MCPNPAPSEAAGTNSQSPQAAEPAFRGRFSPPVAPAAREERAAAYRVGPSATAAAGHDVQGLDGEPVLLFDSEDKSPPGAASAPAFPTLDPPADASPAW